MAKKKAKKIRSGGYKIHNVQVSTFQDRLCRADGTIVAVFTERISTEEKNKIVEVLGK